MVKEVKNNVFYFDGCNTVDLAKKYGTPLYVYSENDIKDKCNELKNCFINKYNNVRVAYASKAFLSLYICKIIEHEGFCLDVVSGGELYVALKAKFPVERIEFNGNNKLFSEIEMAIDNNIGRIIVDSLYELDIIEEICKIKNKKINILYRITPGVNIKSHDYISTGKKDSKFGIPLDEDVVFPYIEKAIKSEYVNFLGFHFHIGSQLHDNKPYLVALETSLKLVKEVKERFNYSITELNLGGGFGIQYVEADNRKPFSYFIEPLMKRIEEFFNELSIPRPAIVIEPGRSIVGEAGITLYTIGSIKEIKGVRHYVSVDGGMTDNIRPALYNANYEGIIANKANNSKKDIFTICGKCCESGDVLLRDIKLPTPETGDIFTVFSTGAYCYSMASNYNKNLIPAVVVVNNGNSKLIIKRQMFDDLVLNDVDILWYNINFMGD